MSAGDERINQKEEEEEEEAQPSETLLREHLSPLMFNLTADGVSIPTDRSAASEH